MPLSYSPYLFLLLLIAGQPHTLEGQAVSVESWEESSGLVEDNVWIAHRRLLEGSRYLLTNFGKDSHPYFGNGQWTKGSITFDGFEYSDVPMLYDIVNQVLLVRNPNLSTNKHAVRINQKRIGQFEVDGVRFGRFGMTPENGLASGFYEILFKGENVQLIARRVKRRKIAGTDLKRGIKYYSDDTYAVRRSGSPTYTRYRNRRTLFQLFPDHREELSGFIKQEGLKPKANNDGDLMVLFAHLENFLGK